MILYMSYKTVLAVIAITCISVPCFMSNFVFGAYSDHELEYFYGNSTTTQLEFNNSTITLEQDVNKTTYRIGEPIYIYGKLLNVGIHDVYVGYRAPAISSELKYQNGALADLYGGIFTLGGYGGNETLKPNTSTFLREWVPEPPKPPYLHIVPTVLVAKEPGNYTVTSMIVIGYSSNKNSNYNNGTNTLWSKPLQITILPEKVPEFPFAVPVLLISVVSVIIFYRIKFR